MKNSVLAVSVFAAAISLAGSNPARADVVTDWKEAVRKDRMPRDEVGIEQPLDEPLKRALLERGAAFEALIDAAKDWEKRKEDSRSVR